MFVIILLMLTLTKNLIIMKINLYYNYILICNTIYILFSLTKFKNIIFILLYCIFSLHNYSLRNNKRCDIINKMTLSSLRFYIYFGSYIHYYIIYIYIYIYIYI